MDNRGNLQAREVGTLLEQPQVAAFQYAQSPQQLNVVNFRGKCTYKPADVKGIALLGLLAGQH